MGAVVVYVHGLWLRGHEAAFLRRRLSTALAAETRAFSYPSMRGSLTDNAAALGRYLASLRADTLHLVAHSLGGLVTLKLFDALDQRENGPAHGLVLPPGRVVLLGSPVRGSRTARRVASVPFGKRILGVTANETLLEPRERRWDGGRELGVICGDVALGLGRLAGRMSAPNDGTVLVEETDLPGATERLRLHVSHSGMVFSAAVAKQTAAFLQDGRFVR